MAESSIGLEQEMERLDLGNLSSKLNGQSSPGDSSVESPPGGTETAALRHMKVAEAAVTGWEKATAESTSLKVQLEVALQEKEVSDRKAAKLDSALKESIRELRRVREEQARRIQDALEERSKEWEIQKAQQMSRFEEQERDLKEMQAEMDAMVVVLEDRALIIQDLEKETSRLNERLYEAEKVKGELEEELLKSKKMIREWQSEAQGSATVARIAEDMVGETKNDGEITVGDRKNGASVEVERAKEGGCDDSLCINCKKLEADLLITEQNFEEISIEKRHCEEAIGLLESELSRMSSRLTGAENKSVAASREAILVNEELDLTKGEMNRLVSEVRELRTKSRTGKARSEAASTLQEAPGKLNEITDKSNLQIAENHKKLESVRQRKTYEKVADDENRAPGVGNENGDHQLNMALVTANNAIAKLSKELADSKQETANVDEELAAVEEMVGQLSEGLAERQSLRMELGEAHEKIEELSDELSAWRKQTQGLQNELESAQSAISSLSKELDGKDDLQNELTASKQRISELSFELAQWRDDTAKLGTELSWAQNRVSELMGAGNEVDELKSQLNDATARLTDSENFLLLAEADKNDTHHNLRLSQTTLTKLSKESESWKEKAISYEAEVEALHNGDLDKAMEISNAREAQNSRDAETEGREVGMIMQIGIDKCDSPLWGLEEMQSFKEEVTADLEAAAQWTVELESRLEEEKNMTEKIQMELGRQRAENSSLNSRLAAATERASLLEASLVEEEGRVDEVRRNLFAMHKEKLTAEMDLALANAAKSELGNRLETSNNQICALMAKLNALVDDSHLARDRREATKAWLLEEGLDSAANDTTFIGGRATKKDFSFNTVGSRHPHTSSSGAFPSPPNYSHSRQPSRSNGSYPALGENLMTGHSSPLPPYNDARMERMDNRLSHLPHGRRSNGSSPRHSGGGRNSPVTTGVSRKANAYYNSPHGRRSSRNLRRSPFGQTENSETETAGVLSESQAEEGGRARVGGKRVVSPLAVEMQYNDFENQYISGNGGNYNWNGGVGMEMDDDLIRESNMNGGGGGGVGGSFQSPTSSQETLSPANTPPSILPQTSGNGVYGFKSSPKVTTSSSSQLKYGEHRAPAPTFGSDALLSRVQGYAGFLSRSKRSRAEGGRN